STRLLRGRGEMKIGVQDLALAKLWQFRWLRFLDLHNHVRARKYLAGAPHYMGPRGSVGVVARADPSPRAALHNDVMTVGDVFTHCAWCQADTIFVVLDFLRTTDPHAFLPQLGGAKNNSGK